MTVYIVIGAPDYDEILVWGVYDTYEKAEAAYEEARGEIMSPEIVTQEVK